MSTPTVRLFALPLLLLAPAITAADEPEAGEVLATFSVHAGAPAHPPRVTRQ